MSWYGEVIRVLYVDAGAYGIAAVDEHGTRWRCPPATGHSVLDELHAIALASEWLAEDRVEQAFVLTDSVSAVKAMYGVGNGGPVAQRGLVARIRSGFAPGWRVAWIPRQENRAANAAARAPELSSESAGGES